MDKGIILEEVRRFYKEKHVKVPYQPGDRINYAGRVYDEEELCNLVDAALDFWLTVGSYTEQFEQGLAAYLGVPFCSLVNSGSSANLLAVTALTSPLLGSKRLCRGRSHYRRGEFSHDGNPYCSMWRSAGFCGYSIAGLQY